MNKQINQKNRQIPHVDELQVIYENIFSQGSGM